MPLTSETGPTAVAVSMHADPVRRATKPLDSFTEPAPIQRLGQWRLHSLLHDGAFTRTYRAGHFSVASDCPSNYFIKVLREEFLDDPVALARLHNEATVGRCVAHRHIVPVLSAHLHRPPYFVLQPLLSGVTVASLLHKHRRLALPSALWIARQAAEGLAALHLCGYIHGDVKPDNWMLAANGHVTLIDLGSARRIHEESTLELRSLVGTPRYMAPELFAGHWPDPRSDIYSLGIALFEMLAGRVPLDAEDVATLSLKKRAGALPDLRSYVPQIPREVSELVRALTAHDPLRRPQPATEAVRRCCDWRSIRYGNGCRRRLGRETGLKSQHPTRPSHVPAAFRGRARFEPGAKSPVVFRSSRLCIKTRRGLAHFCAVCGVKMCLSPSPGRGFLQSRSSPFKLLTDEPFSGGLDPAVILPHNRAHQLAAARDNLAMLKSVPVSELADRIANFVTGIP